jgi:hypothetical protein
MINVIKFHISPNDIKIICYFISITMAYVCNICKKSFARKRNLDYHNNNNACKIDEYHCQYCDNGFTTKTSMYRHIQNNCKIKKKDELQKNEIYERLLKLEEENIARTKKEKEKDKEIIKLKKQNKIKDLTINNMENKINNGNIVNGNIVNGNVINHITLIGYGNEDMSKLDKNEMVKVLQNGYYSTIKLTEAIHFNSKYPEYHNVYITNMKDKYAMMYDGKNWILTQKDYLINKIYDDKKNYIEENLDDFLDSLTVSRKKALERWLETDDEEKKIKEVKENIKLLLYNKRHTAITTTALLTGPGTTNDGNGTVIKKKLIAKKK